MASSMISRAGAVSNPRSTSMIVGSAQSSDVGIQATPVSATSSQSDNHSSQQNSTPPKEKSPMSLLNELARINKISHKYVLTDEAGPAHSKQFTVRLELGTEVYEATNSSIKRAQHAAADVALFQTTYPHPKPKQQNHEPLVHPQRATIMTPTCELNTLAMKHGWSVEYKPLDNRVSRQNVRHPQFHARQHWDYCNISPYSYLPIQMPQQITYRVHLIACGQEFQGEGQTRQLARHNAASQAIRALKPTLPAVAPKDERKQRLLAANSSQSAETAAGDSKPSTGAPSVGTKLYVEAAGESAELDPEISEISKVQVIVAQHKLDIEYDVVHESGPNHQRNFVTRCVCAEYVTEGEGNSKKSSKRQAAARMLQKLEQNYQPIERDSKAGQKNIMYKKRNRNLIKAQKVTSDYGSQIHPICRLLQIQQANKRREPVYSVIEEKQLPGKLREFTIRCQCDAHTCEGRGPSKKAAKRNAAVLMLQILGYSKPQPPPPAKSVLKTGEATQTNADNPNSVPGSNKHVTFKDTRQLESVRNVPGILVKPSPTTKLSPVQQRYRDEVIASAADQLLSTGTSNICQNLAKSVAHPTSPLLSDSAKLEYLSTCLNIRLEFTDFPKGWNLAYCLSLVAVHISKPIVAHGCGVTFDESHEAAAYEALRRLQSMSVAKSYEELAKDLLKCEVNEPPRFPEPAEIMELVTTAKAGQ